ncbi:MAG: methylmalonyl Co-A mutase-associated GTPase MeaB [Deltaproteobacteria bacterium]|nr:methylmalonyl Co-A mutase-associated GTPase MeaB [Deltaproteobacteria bacterium]
MLENGDLQTRYNLLRKIYSSDSENCAKVIGFTGPPGAGKSTIIEKLSRWVVEKFGETVIFAVDPSSHFSGGAILGDRIRFFQETGVYFRSFATRRTYGGLSSVIRDAIRVCEMFNFKTIFVETAGVGQNEIDVRNISDYVVVVLTPLSGDAMQALKAGLLEIGDCVVVNKADEGPVEYFMRDLELSLKISNKKNTNVLKTSAVTGEGLKELATYIETILRSEKPKIRANSVQARVKTFFLELINKEVEGLDSTGGNFDEILRDLVEQFGSRVSNSIKRLLG